jgi:hypothetical protein
MRVYGQGLGPTAVEISVNANGNQVFNGPVPTLDQPVELLQWPLEQAEILFSVEVPVEFQGTIPVEVTVNSGGGLLFNHVSINYVPLPNNVSSGAQEFDFVSESDIYDFRLDGNPSPSLVCPPGLNGDWTLPLTVNSTFAATVNINAGLL